MNQTTKVKLLLSGYYITITSVSGYFYNKEMKNIYSSKSYISRRHILPLLY
jgi:hypothetical protein